MELTCKIIRESIQYWELVPWYLHYLVQWLYISWVNLSVSSGQKTNKKQKSKWDIRWFSSCGPDNSDFSQPWLFTLNIRQAQRPSMVHVYEYELCGCEISIKTGNFQCSWSTILSLSLSRTNDHPLHYVPSSWNPAKML